MNRVILIGRLTSDPEQKSNFVKSVIAVSDKSKETVFVPLIFGGKNAENVMKFKKKGDLVAIEGKLSIRKGNDGKYYTSVLVNSISFLAKTSKVSRTETENTEKNGEFLEIDSIEDINNFDDFSPEF